MQKLSLCSVWFGILSCCSDMLVNICQTAWRHTSEDCNIHNHFCEKLKSDELQFILWLMFVVSHIQFCLWHGFVTAYNFL